MSMNKQGMQNNRMLPRRVRRPRIVKQSQPQQSQSQRVVRQVPASQKPGTYARVLRQQKPQIAMQQPRPQTARNTQDVRPRMGEAGLLWAAAASNPFRESHDMKDIAPKFPDGTPDTIGVVLTANGGTTGAVAPSGYVYLVPPTGTASEAGVVCATGNDPGNNVQSPTGHVMTNWAEDSIVQSLITSLKAPFRVVACGLKLWFAGAMTYGSGVMQAGHYEHTPLVSGAAAWTTYAHFNEQLYSGVEQVRTGITVRGRPTPRSTEFDLAANHLHYYTDPESKFGLLPTIRFLGLGTTTASLINWQAICYLEIRVCPRTVPFAIGAPASEPDLNSIVAYVNSKQVVTEADSFKEVMSDIGGALSRSFRFVGNFMRENPQVVMNVARALASYL